MAVRAGMVFTASSLYLASKILEGLNVSPYETFSQVSSSLFNASAFVALGVAGAGIWRCSRFKSRLDEHFQNQDDPFTQYKRAVQFLKDQLTISQEEYEQIGKEVDGLELDGENKKQAEIQKRIEHLIEKKVKYIKRRTSNRSVEKILEQADGILSEMNSSDKTIQEIGFKRAKKLVQTIKIDNSVKTMLYILGFIAAALTCVTMLGGLPIIFYTISGMIYLGMTVYQTAHVVEGFFRGKVSIEDDRVDDDFVVMDKPIGF